MQDALPLDSWGIIRPYQSADADGAAFSLLAESEMRKCKPDSGLDLICRNDLNLTFDLCRRFAEKLGGEMEEIDAGHDVMLSKPGEPSAFLTKGRGTGNLPVIWEGGSPLVSGSFYEGSVLKMKRTSPFPEFPAWAVGASPSVLVEGIA